MIVDFFTAWATRIAQRGFTGPVVLGLQGIAGQDDPTVGRVVAYPTTDPLTPTTRVGGNPRARRTRNASLEVHCWGAVALNAAGEIDQVQSLRNCESLLNTTITSALDIATGTIDFSPIAWNEDTAIARAGWLAVYTLNVEIPITDTTYTVVTGPAGVHAVTTDKFLLPNGAPAVNAPSCGAGS
jgi:hypothetical protein